MAVDSTLLFISKKLNAFLQSRFPSDTSLAVLAYPRNQDRTPNAAAVNRLALCLIGLEEQFPAGSTAKGGSDSIESATISTLTVALIANFDDAMGGEAMRFLASATAFFQAARTITAQTAPDLPQGTGTIDITPINLNMDETSKVMSMLGMNYAPSAFYKIRAAPWSRR